MDPSAQGGQPYGQYQPYQQPLPYPRPPQPVPVNGLAITSLVVGIVCCLPPLGLILGTVALRQLRRKGGRGKGMAIAGIVLSSISTLLVLLMVLTGGAREAWNGFREGFEDAARSKGTGDLRRGDCFNVPGGDLERVVVNVETVPCDEEHDAEVSGTYRLQKSDPAPGSPRGETFAEERCLDINAAYARDSWALPKDVETYYYIPTEEGWSGGDRMLTCAFTGDALKGSLHVGPDSHDPDQLSYINAEHIVETVSSQQPEADFADDPAAYRSWARKTSGALSEQATALRARSWPEEASAALGARARQFEASGRHWDLAAKAADEDTFWTHVTTAEGTLTQQARIAARDALGLSTTPPPEEG
ncbi:DUF4190 domain-containing protein [Streptomyces xantholiticus]|uniref:DUF4190 domain-containing protein n=1 Tax=Streptomyces xantholiticus TaxID=68285 RepID=A0ABV1USV2_9ACTN